MTFWEVSLVYMFSFIKAALPCFLVDVTWRVDLNLSCGWMSWSFTCSSFFSQAPYNSYRYRLGVNQMPWPNVLNIVQLNFMKIIITCLCMFFYWSVQLYKSFPLCGIPNPFSLSAHTFFLSLWAYVVLFTFHCYELKLDFRLFWFGGCFNLGLDEIWSYKF